MTIMIDSNGTLGSTTRTITVVRDEKPTNYKFDSYDPSTSTFSVELSSNGGWSFAAIVISLLVLCVILGLALKGELAGKMVGAKNRNDLAAAEG